MRKYHISSAKNTGWIVEEENSFSDGEVESVAAFTTFREAAEYIDPSIKESSCLTAQKFCKELTAVFGRDGVSCGKITMIKLVRTVTGADLLSAKNAVEASFDFRSHSSF